MFAYFVLANFDLRGELAFQHLEQLTVEEKGDLLWGLRGLRLHFFLKHRLAALIYQTAGADWEIGLELLPFYLHQLAFATVKIPELPYNI